MSQQFDNVLDLVKQKGFFLMNIWLILKSLKEELPVKEKFYSSFTDRKINIQMLLTFGKNLKWKQWKINRTHT